jgi:hypothetical protein
MGLANGAIHRPNSFAPFKVTECVLKILEMIINRAAIYIFEGAELPPQQRDVEALAGRRIFERK